MWKDIKVTLYDIFGYLLPGAVVMGGLLLFPKIPGISQLLSSLGATGTWVLLLLCSYYLGHLLQGIGNGLELIIGDPVELILDGDSKDKGYTRCRGILVGGNRWRALPTEVLDAAQSRLTLESHYAG